MRTEIKKLTSLTKFLNVKHLGKPNTVVALETPSKILLQNIYRNWLKSIYSKTVQHFPVYLNKDTAAKSQKLCYGYIEPKSIDIDEILIENSDEYKPKNSVELRFNLVVPKQDVMQYFIQWQRYRKYWWSSITSTPSLFSINDMKQGTESADVNIIANFNWGPQVVETISINSNGFDDNNNNTITKISNLMCATGLETVLLTLLLDGISNATKEEYLRLHNQMAPYKISFALDTIDEKVLGTLSELAELMVYKLSTKEIYSLLPSLTLPLQLQIKENLRMGVTYTAILNENTLSNGIFYLLNSNTMLKEQVHVADFASYAALLCGKR